jgi:hypothetical protein
MKTMSAILCVALLSCRPAPDASAPARDRAAAPHVPLVRIDSSPHPEPPDTWLGYRAWTVNELGIGPLRVGMTLAEADSALGRRLKQLSDSVDTECDYAGIEGVTRAVHFLTGNGRIGRVDVMDSTVATSRGIRVGDLEGRVRQAYPGIIVTPHKYTDGHYLTVAPGAPRDTTHLLIFETDGQTVTKYRAGIRPWVEYVEGCS